MPAKALELEGQKFGRLIVIERSSEKNSDGSFKWLCRCTCPKGKELLVSTTNLRLGRVESCGCLRSEAQRIDLTGQRFGRLTAIEPTNIYDGTNIKWLCICDCGKRVTVSTGRLGTNKTKSCGCLARELTKKRSSKNKYSSSFNALYSLYSSKAKQRGIEFLLTHEEFHQLTSGNCFYCGIEPTKIKTHVKYDNSYIYNGVDRVDNLRGYEFNNCVSCCSNCNYAKKQMTLDEFKSWLTRVYLYFCNKELGSISTP